MALALYDRVQQTGTSNTTVSFTLSGTVTGFQSFSAIGNGNTTYYAATDSSGNWEVGLGTYSTTGPTLTRTTIFSSSNSGSAVTFSGAVNVFVTYPAGNSVVSSNNYGTSGQVLTSAGAGSAPTWSTPGGGSAATPTALGTVYGGTDSATPYKTLLGYQAGNSTTGIDNTAIGQQALYTNITGTDSTAIGFNALKLATGTGNTALGSKALQAVSTGTSNVGIGASALVALTTGSNNISLGGIGTNITSGSNNFFAGSGSAFGGGTGSNNVVIGTNSFPWTGLTGNILFGDAILYNAQVYAANYNVCIGQGSNARYVNASYNISLGYGAMQQGTGQTGYNIGIGYFALGNGGNALSPPAGGGYNVGIGYQALNVLTSGATNIALGYNAGTTLTTGTNNIIIGASTNSSSATVSNETTIGNSSTTAARIFGTVALQNGGLTELVYAVTGTTPALSPTNGGIQTWTLSGSSTPTAGTWTAGSSMTLQITASTNTITWSSMPVTWMGGTAPTLSTTVTTNIELWKIGSTIYGALVGLA
jgi:hypothetical protein